MDKEFLLVAGVFGLMVGALAFLLWWGCQLFTCGGCS